MHNDTTNSEPTAVADTFAVGENETATFDVLANDTNPDGDALTLAIASVLVNSANGSVNGTDASGAFAIVEGQLQFTPGSLFDQLAADETATITVSYSITDADGHVSSSTATITVTGANDAPAAPATGSVSTNEDTASAPVDIGASDVDGTLTYTVKDGAGPADGTVSFDQAAGTFIYTPNGNANGTDSFTIVISDGVTTTEQVVSVNVTAVADLTAANDTASTNEDTTLNGSLGDSTTSGGTLSYALETGPANGTVTVNTDGTYSYVPATNYNGSDSFTYTVTDADSGESATQTVSITVNAVNDAPVAPTTGSVSTNEDIVSDPVQIGASDVDGNTLSYSVKTGAGPADGTVSFDQAAGTFTYTPNANANGADSFTIVISDGELTTEQVVNAVNDAPVAPATGSVSTNEDTVSDAVQIGASDVDGNTLTYSVKTGGEPAIGTVSFNQAAGTFTYTPNDNANGADSFTIVISDGVTTTEQVVSVNVTAVTDLTATDDTASTDEDTTLTGNLGDSTTSGGTLSYALQTNAANGTVTVNADGSYSYVPADNFNGSDSFTYTVTDAAANESATRTVSITVNAVNDAPVAVADQAAGGENETLTIDVLANDTDVDEGDVLTLVSGQAPSGKGSVSVQNNQLVFNPGTDFDHLARDVTETVTLSYVITDESGAEASSTVEVTVTGVNDAPVANADSNSVVEDTTETASGNVLTNDTDVDDGATRTVTDPRTQAGQFGTLTLNADGSYSYVANGDLIDTLNAPAQDVFSYSIVDEFGATSTATLTIDITLRDDSVTTTGTTGHDRLDGDRAPTGAGTEDTIRGGGGNDTINGFAGADDLFGGSGNDVISGGDGFDELFGESGKDVMDGGLGIDTLDGGSGYDTMNGGEGTDTLIGASGNDRMTGGTEADTFILGYGNGYDTITDFVIGEDRLVIEVITVRSVASRDVDFDGDLDLVVTFGSGGGNVTLLDAGSTGTITIDQLTNPQPTEPVAAASWSELLSI